MKIHHGALTTFRSPSPRCFYHHVQAGADLGDLAHLLLFLSTRGQDERVFCLPDDDALQPNQGGICSSNDQSLRAVPIRSRWTTDHNLPIESVRTHP